MVWLRVFEAWLTMKLLRSPTFHRGVRAVHKKMHELRHGKDPAEMGGTKIYHPDGDTEIKRFMKYFREELQEQFRGRPKK